MTFPVLRLSWLGLRYANNNRAARPSSTARLRWACAASPTRGALAAAAASEHAEAGSAVQKLLGSGRLNKTALGKLTVGVLREECSLAGLPTEGTKPVLVERLLQWAEGQHGGGEAPEEAAAAGAGEEEEQQHSSSRSNSLGAVPQVAQAAQQEAPQRSGTPASQNAGAGASTASDVSLTFLGTSSGNPTSRRNVSSIAVRFGEDLFVVDVGEGSRNQLRRAGLDVARVRRIYITHLHGDHCFGVCGLLAEICQARLGTPQQQDPILVYGPPELHSLVAGTFRLASLTLTTPVVVTGWVMDPARAHPPRPVDGGGMLALALAAPDQAAPGGGLALERAAQWQEEYDSGTDQVVHPGLTWTVAAPGGVRVVAAQLQHRIPCWGYVFQEPSQVLPPSPAAGVDAAEGTTQQAGPGVEAQQEGQQWVRRGRKLVVLGDTCDSRAIVSAARNCDVVSHEATFMRGMEKKAEVATHSTSEQAGAFARQINAKNLVLTHFSARYGLGVRDPHGRGGRGGGGGRRGGRHPPEGESKAEQGEQDLDEGQLQCIVAEARRTFGSDRVYLASDYFTFRVFPHPPQPLMPGGSSASAGSEWVSDGRDLERRPPQQAAAWLAQRGPSRGAKGYAPRSPGQYPRQQQQQRWQDGGAAEQPLGQQQQQYSWGQQGPRQGGRQWEGAPAGRRPALGGPERQAVQMAGRQWKPKGAAGEER